MLYQGVIYKRIKYCFIKEDLKEFGKIEILNVYKINKFLTKTFCYLKT